MIIRSNVPNWIMVSDINVKIPPMGKGELHLGHEKLSKSRELVDLVAKGTVTTENDIGEITLVDIGDETAYCVPSTDLWGSSGQNIDWDISDSNEEMLRDNITEKKEPERKFKISKVAEYNIMIDSLGIGLSKQVPTIVLGNDKYNDEQLQRELAKGTISLDEVLEEKTVNGKKEWVPVKFKGGDQDMLIAPKGKLCVNWDGPIFDGGGYANMNRQVIFHLDDMGVYVRPSMTSTEMNVENAVKQRLISMSSRLVPIQSPKVFGTTFPSNHVGRCIAYTMMETENVIHPFLVHKLLPADEIWVPCEWNRRTFQNSGVKQDIKVMPLGVDHKTYRPEKKSVYFKNGTKDFVFLSVFNWNWRKGYDVMMKAYIRAFTDKDDVSLVMVSRFANQTKFSHQIYSDVEEYTKNERRENRPHLVLVDKVIPTYLMPRLYNSADAFCLFTRGEGWGLPAIEAAASGVPVLTAYHGGHEMFLDDDVATLVRPDAISGGAKLEWMSAFYKDMEFVDYSDKAINEIAEKMRWVYENREETREKADLCRKRVLENFTWQHAAEKVAERLYELD